MEGVARRRSPSRGPDMSYTDLHLVLVDDRPGMDEDRAHFVAVGADGEASWSSSAARTAAGWPRASASARW